MKNNVKILFSCHSLHDMAGGVERMISVLTHELSEKGFEVHLLTWDIDNARPFYCLNPSIQWHKLNIEECDCKSSWKLKIKRIRGVGKIISTVNPDLIVNFQAALHRAVFISAPYYANKMICAERNSPSLYEHTRYGFIKKWSEIPFIYFCRALLVQDEKYINKYPFFLKRKSFFIPNPVRIVSHNDTSIVFKNYKLSDKVFKFLFVGRLSYQKNLHVLLLSLKKLNCSFSNWTLDIVGDGEDRLELEKLGKSCGIDGQVIFHGKQSNVGKFYGSCDIFCFPSRWEGFPNALAEALSYGIPSIGFEDCDGTNTLIINKYNGVLVPGNDDIESLHNGLIFIIDHSNLLKFFGKNARDSMDKYKTKKIIQLWQEFICQNID